MVIHVLYTYKKPLFFFLYIYISRLIYFPLNNIFMENLQVLHSKKILRSGTVVGSFKIDLHTVYETPGTLHIFS
jgi:hypothetical protein